MNTVKIIKKKMLANSNFLNESILIDHILNEKGIATFINLHSYLVFRKKNKILKNFTFIFSDGIVLTKLLNIFKIAQTKRYSFDMTSIAGYLLKEAEIRKLSICFVGGTELENNMAIKQIHDKYPNLLLVGNISGYFLSQNEEEEEIKKILKLNPDIVIAGLGAGLQEKFLLLLNQFGWKGLGITCGAYISQTALKLNYYPKFINTLNLRWLFRIYKEPKLVYRYFVLYPISIICLFIDIVSYRKEVNNRDF